MTGYSTPATAGELTGPLPMTRAEFLEFERIALGGISRRALRVEAPLADEAKAHVMESWLMRRLDPAALDDLGEELAKREQGATTPDSALREAEFIMLGRDPLRAWAGS